MMNKFEQFANTKYSGLLLNVLLPGAGHVQFREYAFGVFIFLVWLIAAILFYLSFLIDLNFWARLLLFGLPILFYFFTFFDLLNSLKRRKQIKSRARGFSFGIFLVAITYQIVSPTAPVNFVAFNGPEIFTLEDNRLSPLYSQGTPMKASRLAYRLEIMGFGVPILHSIPRQYEIVRFQDGQEQKQNGVVLGLPGQTVEIIEGTVIINGFPDFEGWIGGLTFSGDWPEEIVKDHAILVATLNLGQIDNLIQVPLSRIIGRVEPLFE